TEEFRELGLRPVYVFEMGVMGQTGMESANCLSCLTEKILPAAVIVIDSLACSEPSRLCTTIQLTDSGIAPGSGVGGSRKPLNSDNMGAKVIAIGVPTVIDIDSLTDNSDNSPMIVTPKNIDSLINKYSEIISAGVNSALNPSLSREETELLMPNEPV
ncbi:MAG: GPR endopeptidase, partial [[Eubacterium] siraeum]|nr:GPR endopeptidase [[Eubacterium] siraeum]